MVTYYEPYIYYHNISKAIMKNKKMTILVDTRESVPYLFKKYPDVFVMRDALSCGDFSVFPYNSDDFFIERKTLQDATSSFTAGRERFEAEWKRAKPGASKTLLIEGDFLSIIMGDYRSNFNPTSFLGSIFSWSIKYKFNIVFVKNATEGQICVYWLCREFLHFMKKQKEGEL